MADDQERARLRRMASMAIGVNAEEPLIRVGHTKTAVAILLRTHSNRLLLRPRQAIGMATQMLIEAQAVLNLEEQGSEDGNGEDQEQKLITLVGGDS